YPSARTAGRIDSHWSHGVALRAACPAKPTGAYPESVLKDNPALYLRLNESDRLVEDYSAHCADGSTNAAADGAVAYGKPGATADGDNAIEVAPGATTGIVTQAGTTLPAGGAPRTVEGWVRATNCCDVSLVLARYGTAGAGKLFEVYVQEGFSVRPRMYLATGAETVHVDLPTRWADGAYHQLAAT